MPDYKAPLRDIRFVLNDLLETEQHFAGLAGCEELHNRAEKSNKQGMFRD